MRRAIYYLAVILSFSCCSPDSIIDSEERREINNESIRHNQWIYSQMNHQYLWRADLPDSASCNYNQAPSEFFYSLLSSKDRFSYCLPNNSYEPNFEFFSRANIDGSSSVTNDSIYQIEGQEIGYFCYHQFESAMDFIPLMRNFANARITQLIVDLRYNPGGLVSTCKLLANSIVNQCGYGKIFQQCHYNDRLSAEYLMSQGDSVDYNYFDIPSNYPGGDSKSSLIGLSLDSVYFLVSDRTASASEALIISLRPFMKVVLIGEQTVGKGVGSWTIATNQFQYELHPITMRYYNAVMETTPDSGLVVDYVVKGGLEVLHSEIGKIEEPLLAKAISLITEK